MITFDPKYPLSRCIGEPKTANAGLVDYYKMGSGRTLRDLCALYQERLEKNPQIKPPTTRVRTIFSWSNKFEWQNRVELMEEIDRELEEAAKKKAIHEKMKVWADRQESIRERDYSQAEQLRDLADSVLAEGPKFTKTTRKLIKGTNGKPDREIITVALDAKLMTNAIMAASKLQRLAAEMETEHTIEESTTPEEIERVREKRWEAVKEVLSELVDQPPENREKEEAMALSESTIANPD
jgi:hypothetical protein